MTREILKLAMSVHRHFTLFGLHGVIQRALIMLPGANKQFAVRIPKSCRTVYLRLGTTDVAAFEHVFIKNEYEFTLAKAPSIIIDAGANIGMSSVYFSNRYPAAKILAIEPDPENFSMLKKNSETYPNIVPVNAALWDSDGFVSLQNNAGGSWGIRVGKSAAASGPSVRSMTVNTLLAEHAIDRVDLFKIDIEGAELEMFKTASAWIHRVKMLCVELHDRFRPGCSDAFERATARFDKKWQRGELSCATREGAILDQ